MKLYSLIVRSCAERDIARALADYESIANGLGASFLASTDAAIAAIRRAPEGSRKSHGEYRHVVLRRFPFGVFYIFNGKTISIVAVLPLRQDPDALRARLE